MLSVSCGGLLEGPGKSTDEVGTADDARAPVDSGVRKNSDQEAGIGSLSDILARCSGEGDVLYVDVLAPTNSPAPVGPQTFTSFNARFTGATGSSIVTVTAAVPGNVGGGAELTVSTSAPQLALAPGTYPEPMYRSSPQPYLAVRVGDVMLTADGYTSGSFLVGDTGDAFLALDLSFDLSVPYYGGFSRFIGCVKYDGDPADVISGNGGANSDE